MGDSVWHCTKCGYAEGINKVHYTKEAEEYNRKIEGRK
jgi:hypothetical protein